MLTALTHAISRAIDSSDTNEELMLSVSEHGKSMVPKWINCREAVGPDGITSYILKSCADQPVTVSGLIFNTSLLQSVLTDQHYLKQVEDLAQ